jgi:hypothetical protein
MFHPELNLKKNGIFGCSFYTTRTSISKGTGRLGVTSSDQRKGGVIEGHFKSTFVSLALCLNPHINLSKRISLSPMSACDSDAQSSTWRWIPYHVTLIEVTLAFAKVRSPWHSTLGYTDNINTLICARLPGRMDLRPIPKLV